MNNVPAIKSMAAVKMSDLIQEAYLKGFSDGYLKALLDERAGKTNEDKAII